MINLIFYSYSPTLYLNLTLTLNFTGMTETPHVSAIESSVEMYSSHLSDPLVYLSPSQSQKQKWQQILECVYNHLSDIASHEESLKSRILLPKLLVENFDEEQIWQQVELLNNVLVDNVQSEINKKLSEKMATPQLEPTSNKLVTPDQDEDEDLEIEPLDDIDEDAEGTPGFDLADMDKFCEDVEREPDEDVEDSEDEMKADIFGDSVEDEKIQSKLEMELSKVVNYIISCFL